MRRDVTRESRGVVRARSKPAMFPAALKRKQTDQVPRCDCFTRVAGSSHGVI